jgi:hypothetical protein
MPGAPATGGAAGGGAGGSDEGGVAGVCHAEAGGIGDAGGAGDGAEMFSANLNPHRVQNRAVSRFSAPQDGQ